MCRAMEELCEKAEHRKSVEFAIKILRSGKLSHEKIAEYSGLTMEEIQKIAAENNL